MRKAEMRLENKEEDGPGKACETKIVYIPHCALMDLWCEAHLTAQWR